MNRLKASALAFGSTLILCLVLTAAVTGIPDLIVSPLDGGPLNYHPQLVTSALSPDGKVLVKVFKQRIPSHSRYAGGEMRVYVYDDQGRLLYENMIGQDGAWDELDNAYEQIQFERHLIRISQFWGRTHEIDRAELTQSSSPESLDVWIDSLRRQHNVPAMGAIVFRADTILARGIAGVRRSNLTEPVKESDRFQLGSNTKAITATVIATLVEEGKLKWTTTLAEVFPELRDSMSSEFRDVTIDMLLSHHAGISAFSDTDDKDFKSIPRLSGTPTERRAAFTVWVLRGKPGGPVGKGLYSNGGYTIAGAVAERITGQSWELLVQTRVFKPLGLTGSFAWSNSPDLNQPWGHYETRGGTKPVDPRNPDERLPPIIWPAGSVELSLEDYARFLQLNLKGLQGFDRQLLKSATIKHLHTSPVSPPDKYGLGWGLQDFDDSPASVHVGSAGAFYAVTIIQPTRDLGVAVFANSGGERATAAANEAAKSLIRRFAKVGVNNATLLQLFGNAINLSFNKVCGAEQQRLSPLLWPLSGCAKRMSAHSNRKRSAHKLHIQLQIRQRSFIG